MGVSFCEFEQVADRLGAAHLALPALLRGQLNLPQSPRVSGDVVGSMCDASLSDAIRAGKLVSGAPALQVRVAAPSSEPDLRCVIASLSVALQVLQTAVHAAPQLLILIEHTRLDGPLDLLVSRLRPHLVILQQAPAEEGGQQSRAVVQESNGGTTSHGPETRRAYELKVLRALGEAAPPIQLCSGGIEEASALIRHAHHDPIRARLLLTICPADLKGLGNAQSWNTPVCSLIAIGSTSLVRRRWRTKMKRMRCQRRIPILHLWRHTMRGACYLVQSKELPLH
jgi:hypothetical protein